MAIQERSVQQLVSLASAPASPAAGWCYFDSTLKELRVYDGAQWLTLMAPEAVDTYFARLKWAN
jgi:hypothetical protein